MQIFNSSKAFGAGGFECHEYCMGLCKFGLGFVQDFQNKPAYKTKISWGFNVESPGTGW